MFYFAIFFVNVFRKSVCKIILIKPVLEAGSEEQGAGESFQLTEHPSFHRNIEQISHKLDLEPEVILRMKM